jgi:hypothetical protein
LPGEFLGLENALKEFGLATFHSNMFGTMVVAQEHHQPGEKQRVDQFKASLACFAHVFGSTRADGDLAV